ncbi:MAG: 50S ribosomal protein L21 [Chloroflexi bacterium]|nr:50S ribosomal protein L21 [Chloroflexota bacterium]
MFAVIETGGKQYKVAVGQTVDFEKLEGEPGDKVELDKVLMVSDDSSVKVGHPFVEGARVVGTIVESARGPKVVIFKFKAKKRYRRTTGHRQAYTRVAIEGINA